MIVDCAPESTNDLTRTPLICTAAAAAAAVTKDNDTVQHTRGHHCETKDAALGLTHQGTINGEIKKKLTYDAPNWCRRVNGGTLKLRSQSADTTGCEVSQKNRR